MVGQLKRCFVAVPIPEEIRHALAETLAGIRFPGRFVSPRNWHITLRFLGEVDQVTYERFLSALADQELCRPFRLSVGGLGAFPRPRQAGVIWAGVAKGAGSLELLAAQAEEAAVDSGIGPEERPFRPHLSLSIIRPSRDVTRLLNSVPDFDLAWKCDRIVVYQSHLGQGSARYEPLETYDLIP